MKKFTVITKDGSKWLRPVRDCIEAQEYIDEVIDNAFGIADIPYLGSRPDGTTLDEIEVREVGQRKRTDRTNADWQDMFDGIVPLPIDYHETRIAYTDAEPSDMHINDIMETEEQLAYKSLEEIHKYTTLCTNDDEENLFVVGFIYGLRQGKSHERHISDDYWRRRCEAAEGYISEAPCDHDITRAQKAAYDAWQEIVNQEPGNNDQSV